MSSDPEIKEITISSNADTEILIKEYTREWIGDKEIIKCVLMKVERNKLHETQYFRAMFGHARWLESGSQKISLEEDNCTGMEVLLRSLHGTLDDMPLDSVTVAGTWHVIMSCDKYNVDQKSLSSWFKAWWEHESQKRINIDNYIRFSRELMYPCFVFGNAPAFMAVTRKLVYGELHDQVATILKHGNCECKELTVFEYLRELARIKVWPLEESMRTDSIKKMLERLRLFDATKMRKLTDPQSGKVRPCFRCNTAWGAIVLRAAKTVAEYFDGLCLDCMDLSKDLRSDGDRDEDYWKHNELKKWDTGCRVKHGEPTWYFSFMGRREKRGLIGDL
ncbi:hypothetical protein AtubIFM55763_010093 [Aspergillus tubingensis]|uniref:BTB domain-containing protein n=1 Tax=Aspergillus tubingensis TaxID=5068 RepID=A0A9W6AY36_ASPTU|nr:hypothetical protein AtubIFM54640_004933 [Aspergillus tubingensis]GLA69576.1 hypothetical protein AtubIFM55763_010093 [Aspergillus tubingensis]GLA89672.1 hypothetical protein AtubIFM56815_004160 [Aspergillus tubingensis]GLB20929.1 hypothetical protein AtubIFM61612_010877 [Aspergillus tubingensis]